MADVRIQGLSKRFPGKVATTALADLDLAIEDGQMLVLLGPSGCGKTTTLRCLAGLEKPDSGTIRFGDSTVVDMEHKTYVAPHRRDIGLVFQSFALWPNMTVRRNIEFPLKTRRRPTADRRQAVDDVASMVDLAPALLDKRPHQLSGGQQQRVSLARALVAQPALVLFDEPISSLDAQLRHQVRDEIHKLHRRLGFTGVYVTHDLTEALALGDRVAVMGQGRIVQLGTPQEVFDAPNSAFVAKLLGSGAETYARPERLRAVAPDTPVDPATARLPGYQIVDLTYLGTHLQWTLESPHGSIHVPAHHVTNAAHLQVGDAAELEVSIVDLHVVGDLDVDTRGIDAPRDSHTEPIQSAELESTLIGHDCAAS
jgi:ABC-type sugar transport system ATPase subunit